MLIYEKNNKLNINFDNEISENPDVQIGKDGDKTEVLINGSSNPAIPVPVLPEDVGKTIVVNEDGSYALAEAGGGSNIFRVIISGEGKNITADKSYEEILVAYTNGSLVFAVQNDEYILYLTHKSKTGNLKFTSYDASTGSGGFHNLSINVSGKWTEQ